MDLTDIAQRRPARERILSTAYALFTRRGVRAVGIDEIISQSGVAKATMYRHFPTKNDLVLAVLQRREQLWTYDLVEQQSRLRQHPRRAAAGHLRRVPRLVPKA